MHSACCGGIVIRGVARDACPIIAAVPRFDSMPRIVPWLILAMALVLRVLLLADKNLWLDESVSWQFATGSAGALINGTAADIHPPLYYMLLKLWVAVFGDSLVGLRSLSVVFGTAAVYVTARLVDRTVPRAVACAALFWFAVAPHAVLFSQEARMYAAVTAVVLGACLAYRRWVESAFASRSALTAYTACVVVCLYLHYFTTLALAAISLHALLLATGVLKAPGTPPRRLPLKIWMAVHAIAGVLYLPWVAVATSQISKGQAWRETITLSMIPSNARDMFAGLLGGMSWYSFANVPAVVAATIFVIGLARLAWLAVRERDEADVFWTIVTLAPMVLGLALLRFAGRMDLARYLPYALPFMVIATARGWAAFRVPAVTAAIALLVGAMATLPALGRYYDTHVKDSDARPIVAMLTTEALRVPGAQDTIFVAPGYMDTVLQYISRDRLVYRRVESAEELWPTLAAGMEAFHTTWLVVDYRWPDFQELPKDSRLREVEVPSGYPDKVKLFRVFSAK
jgi:mannosyltransferase